jgi:hypothetical protein
LTYNTKVYNKRDNYTKCIIMFGKAKCKLCGDNVRFVLKHLKKKHPETLNDKDVIQLKMPRIMEKYFV